MALEILCPRKADGKPVEFQDVYPDKRDYWKFYDRFCEAVRPEMERHEIARARSEHESRNRIVY